MVLSATELLEDLMHRPVKISSIQEEFLMPRGIKLDMLRLDEIDPIISGNKLFKLYHFLKQALQSNEKNIITFGGAYSNHLSATAGACKLFGLKCVGLVRGERPKHFSPTLTFCENQGMELRFISREEYSKKEDPEWNDQLQKSYPNAIIIPEGGGSKPGMKGASIIADRFPQNEYDKIAVCMGTGTTVAGLLQKIPPEKLMGFSALKNYSDFPKKLKTLTQKEANIEIQHQYHFGGFAKKTPELISFMHNFYARHQIELDFVYTAKMMFGLFELIQSNHFSSGSRILCIHTGGLQGNTSLSRQEQLNYLR